MTDLKCKGKSNKASRRQHMKITAQPGGKQRFLKLDMQKNTNPYRK